MKLLIITAIKEFEKDVMKILKKGEVKTFTFKEVKGIQGFIRRSDGKQLVCIRNEY
jgi:hypothetical protein